MGKQYNAAIQKQLESYIDTADSQNKACIAMGISTSAISQYRRSHYDNGDIAALEKKLEEFFQIQSEKSENREKNLPYRIAADYIPTSVSEDVYKLIRYCQLERGMVVIHGDAGIGKTKAAEKFVLENPASTIYIQATPSSGTLNSILKLLARSLRIPEARNKLDLVLSIKEKLEGTDKVIIIDEAQHLKLAALEEIRTLSDPNAITRQTGTGIVLIGNTEVYSRMLGKQEARFAQLFSRIRMNRYYSTGNIQKADVIKLFPLFGEKDQNKECDYMLGICRSKWGVRGAVNVYNNAVNNANITYDGLHTMARGMGIGLL